MLLFLLGAMLTLIALAVVWWVRSRVPNPARFHCFRCPGCQQKLRYLASKSGCPGMCPRCSQRWTLPAVPAVPVFPRVSALATARHLAPFPRLD